MHEILVISCTNKTQMVMGEIGSDLWQFHDWPIFNCPKELPHVKVPEKEIPHWIFNLRKHLRGVWWSCRKENPIWI
jgi:hypothetical protein